MENDVKNVLKKIKLTKWWNKFKIDVHGRIMLRRSKLYQSCSAIEKEEGGGGGGGGEEEEEEGEEE
jgi:hypothetical protein